MSVLERPRHQGCNIVLSCCVFIFSCIISLSRCSFIIWQQSSKLKFRLTHTTIVRQLPEATYILHHFFFFQITPLIFWWCITVKQVSQATIHTTTVVRQLPEATYILYNFFSLSKLHLQYSWLITVRQMSQMLFWLLHICLYDYWFIYFYIYALLIRFFFKIPHPHEGESDM